MTHRRPGACIFCGGGNLTVEDVIPKWIGAMVTRNPAQQRSSIAGQRLADSTNVGAILKVRKAVCSSCNNGWMSDLEEEAQPILTLLIRGDQAVVIPHAAQLSLLAWLTMKAMVLEWKDDRIPKPYYSQEDRSKFKEEQLIPDRTAAYLGQRGDQLSVGAIGCVSQYVRLHKDKPVEPVVPIREGHDGYVLTLMIARAVLQVLFLRSRQDIPVSSLLIEADTPWLERVVPIPRPVPAVMPPPRPMNNQQIQAFAKRWATGGALRL